MKKIVFGVRPFLLYHRSGFHSPQPWPGQKKEGAWFGPILNRQGKIYRSSLVTGKSRTNPVGVAQKARQFMRAVHGCDVILEYRDPIVQSSLVMHAGFHKLCVLRSKFTGKYRLFLLTTLQAQDSVMGLGRCHFVPCLFL